VVNTVNNGSVDLARHHLQSTMQHQRHHTCDTHYSVVPSVHPTWQLQIQAYFKYLSLSVRYPIIVDSHRSYVQVTIYLLFSRCY